MLRRVGGHYVVVEDEPAAAEAALAIALSDARAAERETGDEAVLREWTTERQMGRLLTALHA
ncbi:MAG: hypothetical protein E6J90_53895 [Deltaproteobacteria bacterium]|nr:MAG: hypothetical protein E6J90_53895 [Deltaproteobacteria bacterium]